MSSEIKNEISLPAKRKRTRIKSVVDLSSESEEEPVTVRRKKGKDLVSDPDWSDGVEREETKNEMKTKRGPKKKYKTESKSPPKRKLPVKLKNEIKELNRIELSAVDYDSVSEVKKEPVRKRKSAVKDEPESPSKKVKIKNEAESDTGESLKAPAKKRVKAETKSGAVKKLKGVTTNRGEGGWTFEEEVDLLSRESNLEKRIASYIIKALKDDATIPFLVRYRKEAIGNLDAEAMRRVKRNYDEILQFLSRRAAIVKLLIKKEKFSEEIQKQLFSSTQLIQLEEIYEQFKEKKESKVEKARALGIEEAAWDILLGRRSVDLRHLVDPSLPGKEDLTQLEESLSLLISTYMAHDCNLLAHIRELKKTEGIRLVSKMKKKIPTEGKDNFELYWDFNRDIRSVKEFQVLAINRGCDLKVLTSSIVLPDSFKRKVLEWCRGYWLNNGGLGSASRTRLFHKAFHLAYLKLSSFAERLVRAELNEKAQLAGIQVFCSNLKWLLLSPPCRGEVVMAIDPGFQAGCKIAIVSPSGSVLYTGVHYLTLDRRKREETERLEELIAEEGVSLIGLGNGKGCREVEALLTSLINSKRIQVKYIVVSEQGLSIYSCSEEASEELKGLEAGLIGAVSLARRVLDPLSELVKLEPKHLGVGMYQHDLNKKRLEGATCEVMVECVSEVGVDINTAPVRLLSQVAGLSVKKAEAIAEARATSPFISRQQVKSVRGIGGKTFEQCAGFIRVVRASILDRIDPSVKIDLLDSTDIHPEDYKAARALAKEAGVSTDNLGTARFIQAVEAWSNTYQTQLSSKAKQLGIEQTHLELILNVFTREVERDKRTELGRPLYKSGLRSVESLKVGDTVSGRVENVTHFGAFVDIGVGTSGLVHTSQMDGFSLHLGHHVQAKVTNLQNNRIGLQLIKIF